MPLTRSFAQSIVNQCFMVSELTKVITSSKKEVKNLEGTLRMYKLQLLTTPAEDTDAKEVIALKISTVRKSLASLVKMLLEFKQLRKDAQRGLNYLQYHVPASLCDKPHVMAGRHRRTAMDFLAWQERGWTPYGSTING